jgi:DNA-binding MurR/RpiR family transcriptional regulator
MDAAQMTGEAIVILMVLGLALIILLFAIRRGLESQQRELINSLMELEQRKNRPEAYPTIKAQLVEENELAETFKLISNERLKSTARWLNSLATAIFTVGGFGSIISFSYGLFPTFLTAVVATSGTCFIAAVA